MEVRSLVKKLLKEHIRQYSSVK